MTITANKIRGKFLDYFARQGHQIVPSDTLVPKDDPTVLFTTAGMQQFKRQFLGQNITYHRIATSQKCLRTDDLDKVGKTSCHHTFFEMLGNFSFGDYFKKEAIAWAWEFLTKELSIPQDKLWVSVYEDDTEAEKIWLNDVRIPKARLVKLGDKSNFWPSEAKTKGPNGPCGPCSEIFYDYGPATGCGKKDCSPECDCGRFCEVWNLVFTQFNRKEDGSLEPLPKKNIDTGMGFERLVAVMQGKKNNFETDLFSPILAAIKKEISDHLSDPERYLIADHIRAIVFGICDGVIPSNENRGYVIKRLIVDIADLASNAGHDQPVVYKLAPVVISAMSEPYPELLDKQKEIISIIKQTEEAFLKVKRERVPELRLKIEHGENLGELFFKYRDTYGLTLSTSTNIAIAAGTPSEIIEEGINNFLKYMEEQKNRSRITSKMKGDVFTDMHLDLNVPKTIFLGCSQESASGRILKLFQRNEEVKEVKKGDEVKVILDQTPFYAESGGQIGDTGFIIRDKARIKILDTQKIAEISIHSGVVEEGAFKVNDSIEARIDSERRLSIQRNHTATHLLQSALRVVLGDYVKQQGSLVTDERLRFDFSHPKAVTRDELTKIEQLVNDYILSCQKVTKETLTLAEAKKRGALAFFAEKYADTVTVVAVEGFSKELCGGTHLDNVGQVGLFKITGESAIAQGIRRIEAKTGFRSLAYMHDKELQLEKIAQLLKSPMDELTNRIENQTKRIKNLEKELDQLRFDAIKNSLDDILKKATTVGVTKIIQLSFYNISVEILRKIIDTIKQNAKSAAVILGSQTEDDALIMLAVTDDLLAKDIKADEIIKEIAPIIQGSGGGRPQLAQAGSKDSKHLPKALKEIENLIKARLLK